MNDKIKRFTFYNIFFLCAFVGLFMVLSLRSFALDRLFSTTGYNRIPGYPYNIYARTIYGNIGDARYCFYLKDNGQYYDIKLLTNVPCDFTHESTIYWMTVDDDLSSQEQQSGTFTTQRYMGVYAWPDSDGNLFWGRDNFSDGDVPTFYDINEAIQYLNTGIIPDLPFDETLKLDSFKVTSWQIGTFQATFKSKFQVTWSDDRIANVQVRIVGTANSPASFEGNTSPFIQKFSASNYVMKNGDVIHLTATPFKANGEYGESLYYSLVYDDNLPSNWYRKLVNTPYNDNTLTIPYNDVSGQPQSVTLPVDGVTTNNVYKVNYNPVTYEYGDLNLYNIYYSPVLVYPDDTPDEEIDETQDVVNNTYTTNNYYETTKNFNIDFDVDFGDISGSDIQIGYDDTGNFLNSFGKLISKLSTWVLALFPFLPPIVATSIVVVFGLVVSVAIIAFALKIASVIADFIDAIIPG